jgi:2-methylcitrate dehydratase PrpD
MAGISSVADVADLVEGVEWEELPSDTRAATERAVLHVMGTMFLGSDRDISERVLSYARNAAPGGSTAFGLGATVASGDAAFVNATVCHADFRDDAHSTSQSHPGVTVIPAALAAAEVLGRPLEPGALGAAVVAGYQVIGRMGRLGAIRSTDRGFRASAIYTVFGAAAAAARVLGLDRPQLESALALAAHTAAGLNQPYLDGTDDWILLPGFAAKNGLLAALLAREGVVGAPRILEGDIGFYRAYTGETLDGSVDPDLPDWEVETTRLKTMLTCGWNQATVNALVGAGADFAAIDTVTVTLSPEAHGFPGVTNHGPFGSYTAAVLSLPFALGSLLWNGLLDPTSYADVREPGIEEAGRRVTVNADPGLHGYDTVVDVVRRDGTQEHLEVDGTGVRWLLTWDEVIESLEGKFAVSGVDGAIVGRLVDAVPAALSGTDVSALIELVGRGR